MSPLYDDDLPEEIPVIHASCTPEHCCMRLDCPWLDEALELASYRYDLDPKPRTLWERLMTTYDYGDRQPRADFIMRALREHDGPPFIDHQGTPHTPREIAGEIERGTDLGKSLIAFAGIILQALRSGVGIP